MKGTRFSEEQIIGVLKEAESGMPVKEVCRKHGIHNSTYFNWKAKYGGMEVSDAKKLKALEEENRRLKKVIAELTVDNYVLKDINSKKW